MPTDSPQRNVQAARLKSMAPMEPPLVVSLAFRGISLFDSETAAEAFGAERPELPAPPYPGTGIRLGVRPPRPVFVDPRSGGSGGDERTVVRSAVALLRPSASHRR